jgi:hypothetical protein
VAHNLDRFGLWIDRALLQDGAIVRRGLYERRLDEGISPCLALYSLGGRVTSRSRERVLVEYV